MTNVRFYIEKGGNNEVLAVFPDIHEGAGRVMCYAHIGQHSAAAVDYVSGLKKANPAQYHNLRNELINQGYDDLNDLNKPKKILSISAARGLAANWHGGQNTALYSFASTGRILPGKAGDYLTEVFTDLATLTEESKSGLQPLKELTALCYFFEHYYNLIKARRATLETATKTDDNKELQFALQGRGNSLRVWVGRKHVKSNPDNTLCLYMRLDIYKKSSVPVCNGNSHLISDPIYKAICKRFPGFAPTVKGDIINDILELTLPLKERECKPW